MKKLFVSLFFLSSLIAVSPVSAQITIAVTLNNAGGGTVTGTGSYAPQNPVTLVATAAAGYEFSSWNEGGALVTYKNPYTFSANKNRTLVAIFKKLFTIDASANPLIGGKIEGADTYYWNDSVSLVAVDSIGYGFVNWTENGKQISTNPSIAFRVTRNKSFVANFNKIFNISAIVKPADSVMAAGEVDGTGTYFNKDTITLDATAAPGYAFANWTEGGTVVSPQSSYTFQVTRNRNMVANFKRVIKIDARPAIAANGTVSGKGNFFYNDTVTLIATPAYGYVFVGWKEGREEYVSHEPKYSFRATRDRSLIAIFISQARRSGLIGISFAFNEPDHQDELSFKPVTQQENQGSSVIRIPSNPQMNKQGMIPK